jgi:hypothetical protein
MLCRALLSVLLLLSFPVACTPVACTPVACTPVACTPVACTPVACTPVACTPNREVQPPALAPSSQVTSLPKPPSDDVLLFERLDAKLADDKWDVNTAKPTIDYCMHALATKAATRPELHWVGTPPPVRDGEVILLLGPAMMQCAFVGGAGGPKVEQVVRSGADVVVHVGFSPPFNFGTSVTRIPLPPGGGRLMLVVHGSIMMPPGAWADAREHVLPVN